MIKEYILWIFLLWSCNNNETNTTERCLTCNFYIEHPSTEEYNLLYKTDIASKNRKLLLASPEEIYFYKCTVITRRGDTYVVFKNENGNIIQKQFLDYKMLNDYFVQNITKDHDLAFSFTKNIYSNLGERVSCP